MVCTHDPWVRKGSDSLMLGITVTPVSNVLTSTVALKQFDREGNQPPRGRTFTSQELAAGVTWPLGRHHATSWFLTVVANAPGQTGKAHVTLTIGGVTVFDEDCGAPGDGLDGHWRATTWSP